jgi:hypothetical protein
LENLHGRLNDAPIYEEDCVGDFHLESEDPLEIAVTLDCDLEDFGVELVISFMVIEDEDDMMIEIHDLHMDIIGEFNMDELTNCETGLAVESEDPLDLDIEMDCVSGEGESNGHSHE